MAVSVSTPSSPGAINTPMTAPALRVPGILDAEIAPTIAFLCTWHSSYTSGALFIIDVASECF